WLLNNGKIIRDASGMPRLLIGACTDVTALRQSERALRESERRFRSLGEVVPQFVWVTDDQGITEYCNERLLAYMGNHFDASEVSAVWSEYVHPEDKAEAVSRWGTSL